MATTAQTIEPDTPLTLGRLPIAALIVAALASIAASLVFSLVLLVYSANSGIGGPMDAGEIARETVLLTAVATMIAFLFVLTALVVIALPLTLLLVRRGVRPMARDLVLLTVAVLLAVPLWFALDGMGTGTSWIFPIYDLVAAIFWVVALRRMERPASVLGPGLTPARSAAVFD